MLCQLSQDLEIEKSDIETVWMFSNDFKVWNHWFHHDTSIILNTLYIFILKIIIEAR